MGSMEVYEYHFEASMLENTASYYKNKAAILQLHAEGRGVSKEREGKNWVLLATQQ